MRRRADLMRRLLLMLALAAVGGPLLAAAGFAGDRRDLEKLPPACRQVRVWQERCRTGPCNTKQIEAWRERCKRDSGAADRKIGKP